MLQKKIKDKAYLNILFKIIDSTNENVNERIMKIKKKEIKNYKCQQCMIEISELEK